MRVWGSVAGARAGGFRAVSARVRSCARRRASKRRPAGAWDALEQRSAWPGQGGGLGAGAGRNHGARCVRARSLRPRAPGLLPGDRPPPVLAEELVEGLAEQGLDRPALGGAEQAQLAVDGRGKVAGDLDAAGTAVPGGPAGERGMRRLRVPARPLWVFLYQAFRSPGQSRRQARSARTSAAGTANGERSRLSPRRAIGAILCIASA